ncbi:hypothetical protein JXA63_01375 [Candidatus Woesebacteria bacterium]|nr:hypothetical protein [Candidatus Woesebacteria bacterium]
MPSDRKKIKKQIEEEKKQFYGDESIGSGSPDPEVMPDTEEILEELVGNEIDETEPFSVADEIE